MNSPSCKPVSESVSIVAVGDFNPAIFQPLWFSVNGLMTPEQTKAAEIRIIQKRICMFLIDDMNFQIDESRICIASKNAGRGIEIRNLILGIFGALEHTPLISLGFNLDSVFEFATREIWHSLGHRLAPKRDRDGIVKKPGLLELTMTGEPLNGTADKLNLKVFPSAEKVVNIDINQHYHLKTSADDPVIDCHRKAYAALDGEWQPFIISARKAANRIVSLAETSENEDNADAD